MKAFISFPDLDLLATLGNVCRHGDGTSATRLWSSNPELWPNYAGTQFAPTQAPPAADINIATSMLQRFSVAAADFWVMVEYLYHENITLKNWRLEQQLEQDRQKFALPIAHFNKVVTCT